MTDKPTDTDLNALDVTDAEAAEINSIAQPLVPDAAPDANDDLVQIDSTTDGIVFITINRPEKKNAFDAATVAALHETFETLHGADRVRAVFIRGAGGTFSAGADLNWMRDAAGWSESDNRDDAMGLAKMLKALHEIPALTVAVVEGNAMGGGAGIVAACDMAVAVEGARFAFSEVKLGLIPATIAPYVVEAIGARRARQLFLTGNSFDADYAAHAGLIDLVLPEGSVDEFISMLTDSLTGNAPGAMGEAKRLVNDIAHHKIDSSLLDETAKRIARARVSDEGREGVLAFLEKRKASWAR
ncbi:enoyl-CoA hydratase-related protein [Brevundimonas intermedia]|uniref:enoyl-CoA hydratase-related protein n=1 Tax=Brevundimonas intermedia TaxID=74315 RepID=UPI00320AF2CB